MSDRRVAGPMDSITEADRIEAPGIHATEPAGGPVANGLVWNPQAGMRVTIVSIVLSCGGQGGIFRVWSGNDVILPAQFFVGSEPQMQYFFRPPVRCRKTNTVRYSFSANSAHSIAIHGWEE